jgi:hypothetical protein
MNEKQSFTLMDEQDLRLFFSVDLQIHQNHLEKMWLYYHAHYTQNLINQCNECYYYIDLYWSVITLVQLRILTK